MFAPKTGVGIAPKQYLINQFSPRSIHAAKITSMMRSFIVPILSLTLSVEMNPRAPYVALRSRGYDRWATCRLVVLLDLTLYAIQNDLDRVQIRRVCSPEDNGKEGRATAGKSTPFEALSDPE